MEPFHFSSGGLTIIPWATKFDDDDCFERLCIDAEFVLLSYEGILEFHVILIWPIPSSLLLDLLEAFDGGRLDPVN